PSPPSPQSSHSPGMPSFSIPHYIMLFANPPCSPSFVGAIFKWASGVRAFARTIAWLLGIQVVSSVLYIIMIYVEPKSDFIKQCENGSTNSSVVNTCTNEIQEVRGIT